MNRAVLTFALLGLASCGSCDKDKANTNPSASAEPSASVSAAVTEADAGPRRPLGKYTNARAMTAGTPGMLFQTAQGLPDLKDDQKTKIDKAAEPLNAKDAGSERKALQADLAAGVKAGKIEQAKVDADLTAIDKAMKDRQGVEATALNDLYAALEPAQRTAAVAKLRERIAAREAHMPDGGGHLEAFSAKKRVERMTKDLDLDADQQKKVDALAKDDPKAAAAMADARAQAKKRTDALLAAFEKDGFDATKLDLGDTKMARTMADQEVKLYTALLPILTPVQRDKLSARMEKMEARGAWGGRGRGGHGRGDGTGGGDEQEEEGPGE